MKVLLTGGGTGGHITPILAVAHELKQLNPACHTIYVGEKGSKFTEMTSSSKVIDEIHTVSAGKFRRYHRESWLRRIIDIHTNTKNFIDIFKVLIGLVQAWRLLGKLKPDVVFLKGGYVGVPIGLAAAGRRIPIITHDSDAVPGLANRLISSYASVHATALPASIYPYPLEKVRTVGVLVESTYKPVNDELRNTYKKQLGIPQSSPVILVTGGSSGAVRINKAIVEIVDKLFSEYPEIRIIHQVGKGKAGIYKNYQHERLIVQELLTPLYIFMGAADIVVTRAGANTMAELGVQGKACIVIPNPDLTGGHQIKNAYILEEQGSAVVVREENLYKESVGLLAKIELLLNNPSLRHDLAKKLQNNTVLDAADKLAKIIIDQSKSI